MLKLTYLYKKSTMQEQDVIYHDLSNFKADSTGVDINQKVLDTLKLFSDFAQGVKRNKIYTMLKDYASEEQVNASINTLIKEGLAYVTINYDYVKAL